MKLRCCLKECHNSVLVRLMRSFFTFFASLLAMLTQEREGGEMYVYFLNYLYVSGITSSSSTIYFSICIVRICGHRPLNHFQPNNARVEAIVRCLCRKNKPNIWSNEHLRLIYVSLNGAHTGTHRFPSFFFSLRNFN